MNDRSGQWSIFGRPPGALSLVWPTSAAPALVPHHHASRPERANQTTDSCQSSAPSATLLRHLGSVWVGGWPKRHHRSILASPSSQWCNVSPSIPLYLLPLPPPAWRGLCITTSPTSYNRDSAAAMTAATKGNSASIYPSIQLQTSETDGRTGFACGV